MAQKRVATEARVAVFYEKITGETMRQGRWRSREKSFAEKIVYMEDACRSVLSAIESLEQATSTQQIAEAEKSLTKELRFFQGW